MTPVEAVFAALVLRALTKWLRNIIKKVMLPWNQWKAMPDPYGVHSDDAGWQDSVGTLVEWLDSNPAKDGWAKNAKPQGYSASQQVQQHLDQVRNLLVRIPDEVFSDIRAQIAAGAAKGESVQTIAERIENMLQVNGSENWPKRAQVIAVTEVNGAFNAAWFAGAQQSARDLGQPMTKRWLASHDSHVRPSHKEADGQVRPLLEPFIVGGWPMQYPGDKDGPPEEVINCRCTAVLEAS